MDFVPQETYVELTSQAVCVKRNNEELSFNHCCRVKTVNTTYSECVSAALLIQHSKLMRHTPPVARMSVSCECCVCSDRGLRDEVITCPEKTY